MADVTEIIARMERFESGRANFNNQYQDCADYGMPQNNQIMTQKAKGQVEADLYDTTAEESNIQLAAGLYSYMFPTEGRAFALEVDDPELNENDNVKQWLERTTKIIHKHLVEVKQLLWLRIITDQYGDSIWIAYGFIGKDNQQRLDEWLNQRDDLPEPEGDLR